MVEVVVVGGGVLRTIVRVPDMHTLQYSSQQGKQEIKIRKLREIYIHMHKK